MNKFVSKMKYNQFYVFSLTEVVLYGFETKMKEHIDMQRNSCSSYMQPQSESSKTLLPASGRHGHGYTPYTHSRKVTLHTYQEHVNCVCLQEIDSQLLESSCFIDLVYLGILINDPITYIHLHHICLIRIS